MAYNWNICNHGDFFHGDASQLIGCEFSWVMSIKKNNDGVYLDVHGT